MHFSVYKSHGKVYNTPNDTEREMIYTTVNAADLKNLERILDTLSSVARHGLAPKTGRTLLTIELSHAIEDLDDFICEMEVQNAHELAMTLEKEYGPAND